MDCSVFLPFPALNDWCLWICTHFTRQLLPLVRKFRGAWNAWCKPMHATTMQPSKTMEFASGLYSDWIFPMHLLRLLNAHTAWLDDKPSTAKCTARQWLLVSMCTWPLWHYGHQPSLAIYGQAAIDLVLLWYIPVGAWLTCSVAKRKSKNSHSF